MAKKGSILGGLPWASAGDAAAILSSLAGFWVAARFVPPREIGLLGFALVVLRTLEALTHTGFDRAAVQRKAFNRDQLNVYFTVQAARGVLVALLLCALAAPIALLFAQPGASPVLYSLAAVMFAKGLVSPEVVSWGRALNFRRLFVMQLVPALARGTTTIVFAILWKNVWALVVGELAFVGMQLLFSHGLAGRLPRFRYDLDEMRKLFEYGRWMNGMSILLLIMNKVDDLYVTYALGTKATAFYQLAFEVANSPSSRVGNVVGTVSFPVLSRVSDQPARRKRLLLAVLQAIGFVSFGLAAVLMAGLGPAIRFALPESWEPAIPIAMLLTVSGTLRSLVGVAGTYALAVGRPDLEFKMNLPRAIMLLVLLIPLTAWYGLFGTAITVNIAVLMTAPTWLFIMFRIAQLRADELLGALLAPAMAGLALYLILRIATSLSSAPAAQVLLLALGVGLSFVLAYGLDRMRWLRIREPFLRLREPVDGVAV